MTPWGSKKRATPENVYGEIRPYTQGPEELNLKTRITLRRSYLVRFITSSFCSIDLPSIPCESNEMNDLRVRLLVAIFDCYY